MWGEVWGRGEVLGKVWESVLECGGSRGDVDVGKCVGVRGRCGEVCWDRGRCGGVGKCWERCQKVCWGVGEVRGDVGGVWGCEKVLGEV